MSNEPAPTAPIAGAPKVSALIAFDGGGLVLNTMEQAFVFAKAVIASGLAPKAFQTAEGVLIAVQMGAEIGLPPMASLQNIAVINGKPGVYGDVGIALLRAKGFDIEQVCDGSRAVCTITHPRQKPVVRTFTVDDAKKAQLWGKQGPWSQYPSRMLSWKAFWWAARDAAADVLKGVGGVEEIRDLPPEPKNITPPPAGQTLAALDAPREVETVAPDAEGASAAPSEPAPAGQAVSETKDFDAQTLVDLIEGLMLDLGVSEEKLISEAVKCGYKLPAKIKKLADVPEETLKFMLAYLKESKK